MGKKKSRGQVLYEVFKNTDRGKWGTDLTPWDDAFECIQVFYEKAAKKIYAKWYREFKYQAINEALKGKK